MFGLSVRNNRGMTPYNPFREMEELERAFFGDPFGRGFRYQNISPFKTDVTDEGDHYLLEADLPGMEKKDIQLELQGNTLTIRAERHSKVEKKDEDKIVHMERSYGSYSRSFDITGVEAARIKAKYDNGVLRLTLPKKEKRNPETKKLEIE